MWCKKAIFPGTFDPFTIGHESIVRRGLDFFDHIVIAIGINEAKRTYFTLEQRLEMISRLYAREQRVEVVAYDMLTADYARQIDAQFILRGIRTVNDFEYEKTIADTNRILAGQETVLLFTQPEYACISSTVVRELLKYGKDITRFVPDGLNIDKYIEKA